MEEKKYRNIFIYKHYFLDFFRTQKPKVKEKILWTFMVVETVEKIPAEYFKHMAGTDGLYEIRVQLGTDIFGFSVFSTKENW